MKNKIILLVLFIFVIKVSTQADTSRVGTDSVYSFEMPELILGIKSGDKTSEIDCFKSNKVKLIGDSLLVNSDRYNHSLNIKNLQFIRVSTGSHFLSGAAIGASIGVAVGFLMGSTIKLGSDQGNAGVHGGFIGAGLLLIPCGIIGGIIGLTSIEYKTFNLDKFGTDKKREKLIQTLEKNRKGS